MTRSTQRPASLAASAEIAVWVKFQILTGAYKKGRQIPTAQELARQFDVDPNTVRAAYAVLKDEGYLDARRGRGTFVKAEVTEDAARKLKALIDRVLEQAREIGLSARDLAAIIWIRGRMNGSAPRVWYVDAQHPYFDAFAASLEKAAGAPVAACDLEDLEAAGKPGPGGGDIVFTPQFYFERVRTAVAEGGATVFPITPRMAPEAIGALAELAPPAKLGVVCIEGRFAKISGKVIEKSGIALPQIHGNTTDIESLSAVYRDADAVTMSTVAMARLKAAGARLPDKTVVPFAYEIEPSSLAAAAGAARSVLRGAASI